MIEQLESDLRDALARRASELPADATARLRGLDYHPRTHRLRPPVAVGALVTLVLGILPQPLLSLANHAATQLFVR